MTYPINYTYLGFKFNTLVDAGEMLAPAEVVDNLRNGTLFSWLKSRYRDRLDLSLYRDAELKELEDFFENLANVTNMGIARNGMCLLIAFCLEGAQSEATNNKIRR